MAISLGSSSVTFESIRRTWRLNIETALGSDYFLTAHRELVKKDGSNVISKDPNVGVVSRALSASAAETFTCQDDTVISVAHIAEALAGLVDRWETEDNE